MLKFILLCLAAIPLGQAEPETVIVRLQAKPGSESALAGIIAKHWSAAQRLKLVLDSPHLTLRRTEEGKTYFIEIFSWRDASVPDSAPAEIRAIWDELNGLVETRGGHQGLEFTPVTIENTVR